MKAMMSNSQCEKIGISLFKGDTLRANARDITISTAVIFGGLVDKFVSALVAALAIVFVNNVIYPFTKWCIKKLVCKIKAKKESKKNDGGTKDE